MAAVENNVRRLRHLTGETLEDLAKVLDVDPSTVGKWEKGTREIPDEFKVRIARHYGWPVHAVFLFDSDLGSVSVALRMLTDRLSQRDLEVAS